MSKLDDWQAQIEAYDRMKIEKDINYGQLMKPHVYKEWARVEREYNAQDWQTIARQVLKVALAVQDYRDSGGYDCVRKMFDALKEIES